MSVCFTVGFLASCATVPVDKPIISDTFVINRPFAKVWGATVATLAENSIPIKVIEKESGIITTEQIVFASGFGSDEKIQRIAQLPYVFMSVWNSGKYYLSIYITAGEQDTTNIKITTHIEGYESNPTKRWHECFSKGVLENELHDSIVENMK